MNVTSKQKKIAQVVFQIQDAQILAAIESFIYKVNQSIPISNSLDSINLLALAMQPTPNSIDINELAKVQGYNGKRLEKKLNQIDHSLWADEDMATLNEILR